MVEIFIYIKHRVMIKSCNKKRKCEIPIPK